jgi:hypothetical protein
LSQCYRANAHIHFSIVARLCKIAVEKMLKPAFRHDGFAYTNR